MSVNFIVGTGRCGTTILGMTLNNHSRICVPPELQIIIDIYSFFKQHPNKKISKEYCQQLLVEKKTPKYFFNFSITDFLNNPDILVDNSKNFLSMLFREILKANNKDILIKQVPWYGQFIELLVELYPDAKFIHIIRDGRDVALSFLKTTWWSDSCIDNLTRWNIEITKIRTDASKFLKSSNYIEIRYEDLIINTVSFLKILTNFLGVSFERQLLDYQRIPQYDTNSTYWLHKISSDSFRNWLNKKNSLFFTDRIAVWKKHAKLFTNIPENVTHTLKILGYLQ